MTQVDSPNLTLGNPPKGLKIKKQGASGGLLWMILLVQIVVVALVVFTPSPQVSRGDGPPAAGSAQELKSVALELEERSLFSEAAAAWEKYVDADPAATEKAQILYRAGKHYMKADAYEKAAAAFVRCELAADEDPDLKSKVGPLMVDCLRKLGLHGEVGRELSRRVEVGAEDRDQGRVVATLKGEILTDADLDHMIERRVDQMLALQGASGSGQQRTAMLQQLQSPDMRRQLLQEFLSTELFSRRARELKMDLNDDYLKAKELMEQNLLAARFLQDQMGKISPTQVDLESYYSAFKEDYRDEEADRIPDLAEVREQVYKDYVSRKQQEMQEALSRDLMARYEVKILADPGTPPPPEKVEEIEVEVDEDEDKDRKEEKEEEAK